MEIELHQAIDIALNQQLYKQQQLSGKEGLRQLVRQLGYVQIDTISVVERAHHHTIWSRMQEYQKSWLDELLEQDRAIFEYWGHAASYLPMEDYRYSLPRMQRFPDANSWEKQFFAQYHHLMEDILLRIKQEGPLGARDFVDERKDKPANGWGSGKPAKLALELLFWKGELMISKRKGFQRIYDLRERILPPGINTSLPKPEELYRHLILRSLNAMGIGSLSDIQSHFMVSGKHLFASFLLGMVESGEIQQVSIQGIKEAHYILPHALTSLEIKPKAPEQVFLLSPFDNLLILRPRLKRIFAFDYTLECYTPPAKRKYGYWCLPVLYKGKFIGRLDCKANRASGIMEIVTWHPEPGLKADARLKSSYQATFDKFAAFCGCQSVKLPLI